MMDLVGRQLLLMEEMVAAGGPVMVPLIFLSILMWTLIIQRALSFRRLNRGSMGRREAAACILENRRPGETGSVVAMLVHKFMADRSGDPHTDARILDETVMSLVSGLNRYLGMIGVLVRLAPLLGLLGTVVGMINTFDVISVSGTGNVRGIADGISQALITTQTGLLTAIPGLYMHHFLTRRADSLSRRVASVAIHLQQNLAQGECANA